MGGSALKNTVTRRHNRNEYFKKTNEIMYRIRNSAHMLYSRIDLIPAYHSKESFGDADILYSTETDEPFLVSVIQKEFNPNEIIKNGEVISFDFEGLQVDLIHAKMNYYSYAFNYFSYNDVMGNFVGKIARHFGLSHGHDGLYLKLRNETGDMIDKILVTYNFSETIKFLGLSPEYKNGFETLEDAFRYIQSSKYFTPEVYKLENVSSIGRVRDRKRITYRKFLEFNESYEGPVYIPEKDKSIYLPLIFFMFEGTEERFTESVHKYTIKKVLASKFNGDIVLDNTGLTDKSLGKFMVYLKSKPMFNQNILLFLPDKTIRSNIRKEFSTYTETN